MNVHKELAKRFWFKLYNAKGEIDSLVEFIQVHNEDDDSAAFRRGCEVQDELKYMATRLAAIFDAQKESDK